MKRTESGLPLLKKKPVYPQYGMVEPKPARLLSRNGWWWVQFPGQAKFGLSVYKGEVRWADKKHRRYIGKRWRELHKQFKDNDASLKHEPSLDPPF
jgi:hypothetical protein